MSKNLSKCLWVLLAFSVAIPLDGARAQTEPPAINPGAPNAPMSVHRDDAGNIDRSNESRPHPSTPAKPQSLSEFQMLVADSVGRILSVYGADLFANVPDTFAPVQHLPVTPDSGFCHGRGALRHVRMTRNRTPVADLICTICCCAAIRNTSLFNPC